MFTDHLTGITICQQGVYCAGITLYNKLPLKLKLLPINSKQLKKNWKNFYFLLAHAFYSVDEFIALENR
jgi:hypothetical protein